LAAAAGLHVPASGFHADIIRIPLMVLALAGALVNVYVIWRVRRCVDGRRLNGGNGPCLRLKSGRKTCKIVLALATLVLLVAEWITHPIVHRVP
jgi:hypothetical protein